MQKLLERLKNQFPDLSFKAGNTFTWSPKNSQIIYKHQAEDDDVAGWSLLHEVGHALLDHHSYKSDFQLLVMELAAWEKAKELAKDFGTNIDDDHIEDCLDTYREWLYQRSTCPYCVCSGLQSDSRTYSCLNCRGSWQVSSSRTCRPYRRKSLA